MIDQLRTTGRGVKRPNQRQLRVGEALRHGLVRVLARGDLRDPALSGLNLTVTEVRVSPDMKNATAFVVPLGGDGLAEAAEALNRAAGFLRSEVAREVQLRHTPRISFEADHTFDRAGKMQDILDRPRVRRDLSEGGNGHGA